MRLGYLQGKLSISQFLSVFTAWVTVKFGSPFDSTFIKTMHFCKAHVNEPRNETVKIDSFQCNLARQVGPFCQSTLYGMTNIPWIIHSKFCKNMHRNMQMWTALTYSLYPELTFCQFLQDNAPFRLSILQRHVLASLTICPGNFAARLTMSFLWRTFSAYSAKGGVYMKL